MKLDQIQGASSKSVSWLKGLDFSKHPQKSYVLLYCLYYELWTVCFSFGKEVSARFTKKCMNYININISVLSKYVECTFNMY